MSTDGITATTDRAAPTPARLDGKVAVVMGAGSAEPGWSNGKACAVTYARAGAAVVCADLNLDAALLTAKLIEAEGGRAVGVRADATCEDDVAAAVALAQSEFGRLDVMHNNVGYGGVVGPPDRIPAKLWDREIAVNLTSAYLGIRCAVPPMRAQGGGSIITTSSTMAVRFFAHPSAAYTASKAAVEALTRTSAVAYGPENIRVNCVRIGISETAQILAGVQNRFGSAEERQAALARSRRKVPLRGEHGDPFDVADAALFLASDAARYVTGVVLDVDGGLVHNPL